MKVGDLVKIKWITFASMRRQKHMGKPVGEPGLVLEAAGGSAEILFPSQGGKTHKFPLSRLEIINKT